MTDQIAIQELVSTSMSLAFMPKITGYLGHNLSVDFGLNEPEKIKIVFSFMSQASLEYMASEEFIVDGNFKRMLTDYLGERATNAFIFGEEE